MKLDRTILSHDLNVELDARRRSAFPGYFSAFVFKALGAGVIVGVQIMNANRGPLDCSFIRSVGRFVQSFQTYVARYYRGVHIGDANATNPLRVSKPSDKVTFMFRRAREGTTSVVWAALALTVQSVSE